MVKHWHLEALIGRHCPPHGPTGSHEPHESNGTHESNGSCPQYVSAKTMDLMDLVDHGRVYDSTKTTLSI